MMHDRTAHMGCIRGGQQLLGLAGAQAQALRRLARGQRVHAGHALERVRQVVHLGAARRT